jgi:hypothetical protein
MSTIRKLANSTKKVRRIRSYHLPVGDPCSVCGRPHDEHTANHTPILPPDWHYKKTSEIRCTRCDLPILQHRTHHQSHGDPCKLCGLPLAKHKARSVRERLIRNQKPRLYMGIDGEGQGRAPHRYVMLACSDEHGNHKCSVENPEGLSTVRCLEFILGLPNRSLLFAYAFNYDLTKILEDLNDETLYLLFRPELRKGEKGPLPIDWLGYELNLQGTRFTVRKGDREQTIWDIFKFFQAKFVNALEDWKVGAKERIKKMAEMKDKRADFDKLSFEEIRGYCFEECRYMAELARRLTEAHREAGLRLRAYYGAGSSAAAMLTNMGIKKKLRDAPDRMRGPIAQAFFGGRFEISRIGRIDEVIYNYDISSAYPYQLYFLPCLEHGIWQHTRRRKDIETARTALIRYEWKGEEKDVAWGPFPYRDKDGSICFPVNSGGGWIWREEFLAGKKLFKNIVFKEAWIYHCDCDCQPFKEISRYYLERLKLGKEGAGIVLKLGCNSCYGKLAQSIGNAPFNNWIWAGMITSGCRAQLLDMLGRHQRWENLVMMATDGIFTKEKIDTPKPRDTKTFDTVFDKSKKEWVSKPLGGWEEKKTEGGVFLARPGIYFPLEASEADIKSIKARGIGRGVLLDNREKIVEAFEKDHGRGIFRIAEVTRFKGAKTSIHRRGQAPRFEYTRGDYYGQWIPAPIDMTFNPLPKRERILDDLNLEVRTMAADIVSLEYKRALLSQDAKRLKQAFLEMLEQPDCDEVDYNDSELE